MWSLKFSSVPCLVSVSGSLLNVGASSLLGLLERQSVVVHWAGGLALRVGREGLGGGSVLLQNFSWPYRDPRALPPELCWGLDTAGCHFSEVLKNRNKN